MRRTRSETTRIPHVMPNPKNLWIVLHRSLGKVSLNTFLAVSFVCLPLLVGVILVRVIKIVREGQPCRICGTPVVRRSHTKASKPSQAYWFEYWFACPNPECQM